VEAGFFSLAVAALTLQHPASLTNAQTKMINNMNTAKRFAFYSSFIPLLAAFLLAGCASNKEQTENTTPAAVAAPVVTAAPAEATASTTTPAPVTAPESNATPTTIRINAGSANSYTDSSGNVWLPDQGFADGDTIERDSSMQITNTPDPAIYRTEHYGMSDFSYTVPNGKYIVKLHFAETYEDITGTGQRVFSFNVAGQEFKDFDVWAKAGGGQRAYVETVNVNVTNGKLDITFTTNIQSPEINGIEIIPAS
jgi:hypothetical protein